MKTKILILTIAAALPAAWTYAQDAGRPPGPPKEGARPPGARDGDRPKGDGPRDGQRPGPMPIPFLHALDKDGDGIISADEIKNASDALKTLDKNKDGQLTRDEWQPQPPPRPPEGDGPRKGGQRDGDRPRGGARDGNAKAGATKADAPAKGERPPGPPMPLVEALDTDHDGVISADEIGKAPESLAKLDKNSDGQLGPREYGPQPPEGQPPREGGRKGDKPEGKPAQ